jgi:hypothetical protein
MTVSNWVEVFNCLRQTDGIYTLARSSSNRCFDETWNSHLPSIVFFGLVNIAVSPALLIWKLWQLRRTINTRKVQRKFGHLIGAFHPAFFYWELVLTAKRALLFFSLSFFEDFVLKYFLGIFSQLVFVYFEVIAWPYKSNDSNRLKLT